MSFSSPPEILLRRAISGRRDVTTSACDATYPVTYKAAVCLEIGKPLVVQELPRAPLRDDQVRVAIRCTGVAFASVLLLQGKYQEKVKVPYVGGNEFSGQIIEVGSNVHNLRVGDQVFGLTDGGGCFAEEVVTSAETVMKAPADTIRWEEACSLFSTYSTAYLALKHKVNLQPGETVLVTAAAGALGLATIDLAVNVFGAKVIGAAGGPEKCSLVRKKGAMEAIDYTKESISERIKQLTRGVGVNVILDAVGGKVFEDCLRCIAFEGRIVVIGFASGNIPKIATNRLLLKSCTATGVWWGNYKTNNPRLFDESVREVANYYLQRRIQPYVGKSFPLNKINDACDYIMNRQSTGKVVLDMTMK